jgi:Na+/phosphate symporter
MPIMGPQVSAVYLHKSIGYPTSAVLITVVQSPGKRRAMMIVLVLELCGGACAFSTIVFVALASVSKAMPDWE